MKKIGVCLIIAGVMWGIFAFNTKTSITTEGQTFGEGLYSIRVPSQTVHNLGLADQRRNHLIGAAVTLIAGILLFGFGAVQTATENSPQRTSYQEPESRSRVCPFCAETIKYGAVVCRFCGREPLSDAKKHNKLVEPKTQELYETYSKMSVKERKDSCFACKGDATLTGCKTCDYREANLQKYLEAKQAIEA